MPQVFVQGECLHTLEVSPEATVESLKSALATVEGVSVEDQVLTYGGVPLQDGSALFDCVPEMGTLSVNVRVVGGKYTFLTCRGRGKWFASLCVCRQGSRLLGSCWES